MGSVSLAGVATRVAGQLHASCTARAITARSHEAMSLGLRPAAGCRRDLGVAASPRQAEIPLTAAKAIQHGLREVACRCGKV
jgi:hypothetical protein